MDRTERFYKIDQLLQERRCVALQPMIEALGVSRATAAHDWLSSHLWNGKSIDHILESIRPTQDRI